jgi:uncharacterized protein (TIGR03083 family)
VISFEQQVDAIRREGAALAASARTAGVDARVPSCPEWTVADLLGHTGRIHRWVASIITDRRDERGAHWSEAAPPPNDELLDWFESSPSLLADALAGAGPDVELWSWTPDRTTAFWARRQSVETAVHRYDAQLAAGAAAPVEHALAADGVDELFWLIPYWPWGERVRGDGETLHFHCTDGEGEWLVRLTPEGADVQREHAKGDVAARGTASDLLLFLYGRVSADCLEVFGSSELLAHWRELVNW